MRRLALLAIVVGAGLLLWLGARQVERDFSQVAVERSDRIYLDAPALASVADGDASEAGLAPPVTPRHGLFSDAIRYESATGYWTTRNDFAAGGLYSTASDLLRWDRALGDDGFLPPAQRAAMFRLNDAGYGYGWRGGDEPGHTRLRRVFWHTGFRSGYAAAIFRFPDDDWTVTYLFNTNLGGTSLERMFNGLCDLAQGLPHEVLASPGGAHAASSEPTP